VTSPMNFFAVIEHDLFQVVHRIQLTREDQLNLTALFDELASEFMPEDHDVLAFDPGYTPGRDELFVLRDYRVRDSLRDAFDSPLSTPVLAPIELEQGHLKSLVAVRRDGEEVSAYFQAIDTRNILRPARFSVIWDRETFRQMKDPGLVFGGQLCAVLQKGDLYFKSFFAARKALELSEYFTEASEKQVDEILQMSMFAAPDPARLKCILNERSKRKLGQMLRTGAFDIIAKCGISKVRQVAADFGVSIETTRFGSDERIVLPADRKLLAELLSFLDRDFLSSPLTAEQFRVNSKRKVRP